MAHLVTLSRFLLLLVVIALAYGASPGWQLLNPPLVILMFITDGIDGYIARRRHETSLLGAVFDIAADRIVEYALWIVLAHLGEAPIWVPLLFVIRGTVVDAIRSAARERDQAPFDMMRSRLGRFLVAGPLLRISYAVVKAAAFCWLLLIHPLPDIAPDFWSQWSTTMRVIGDVLIGVSVALCLARGLPVIIEFVRRERPLLHHDDSEAAE
jgi:CDP-diacylglycerol--glycerol-3-phosphate 3-phosphatidyltransferase